MREDYFDVIKNNANHWKMPLLIAVFQWGITNVLHIDKVFFEYESVTSYYVITKTLYLLFLVVAWCFILHVYEEIKLGNPLYKRGLQVFGVYFAITCLLMLILWPGMWAWDDLWTLSAICEYSSFNPWQHVITGIYQDILLQILPFPGGIIILQNVIVSLCVGVCVTKLESCYGQKNSKTVIFDTVLKIIPFLLPPVLIYQFSGYRAGLYLYLELVMLVMLLCANKEKMEWNWCYLLLFSFVTIVVSSWRTESFIYIPGSCILVCCVKKDILPLLKKIVCMLLLVVGFLGMNKYQNRELGNSNYQIISLMRPCVELIRVADLSDDAEDLAYIDKVIDLEVVQDNPQSNGETIYWNTKCVRNRNDDPNDDYSKEDYNNFLKSFLHLTIKYPKVVLAERWNLFLQGTGVAGEQITNVKDALTVFESNSHNAAAQTVLKKHWFANRPVFKSLRKNAIIFLGGTEIGVIKRIIYNAMIPIAILLCFWVELLIKKKWYSWIACSMMLIKLPIIILTQPSGWIMYFLSFYFLGYVCLAMRRCL